MKSWRRAVWEASEIGHEAFGEEEDPLRLALLGTSPVGTEEGGI